MAGLSIEYVDPKSLKLAAYNPRSISEDALKRLAKLLDKHGFVDPVIARGEDRLLIGGHQRIKANALRAKPDKAIPCIFLDGVTDEQAKALNIALNNPKAQGEWDKTQLSEVLSSLETAGDDLLAMTAFSEVELQSMIDELSSWQDEAGQEFDESAADKVKMITCPKCKHEFPL